jgi:hypothetical protein
MNKNTEKWAKAFVYFQIILDKTDIVGYNRERINPIHYL